MSILPLLVSVLILTTSPALANDRKAPALLVNIPLIVALLLLSVWNAPELLTLPLKIPILALCRLSVRVLVVRPFTVRVFPFVKLMLPAFVTPLVVSVFPEIVESVEPWSTVRLLIVGLISKVMVIPGEFRIVTL